MPDGSRIELPLQTRLAPISSVDQETRVAHVVWSTGEGVKRYDWENGRYYWEVLSLDPSHVRLERLNGGAPLLNTHNRYSLADMLGVVQPGTAKVDGKRGEADVRFSKRDDVEPFFRDVVDKIITNISVGYRSYRMEMTAEMRDGIPVYRVTDWEPMELSPVPIGADAGAGFRSEPTQQKYPCEIIDRSAESASTRKESVMPDVKTGGATATAETQQQQQTQTVDTRAVEQNATKAERARVTEIRALCTAHKLDRAVEDGYIGGDMSLDQVRADILVKLADKSAKTPTRSAADITVEGDERLQRRELIAEAIAHRGTPGAKISDGARQYRHMSLLRLAEEVLTHEGVSVRGMSRLDMATRSMMSTSDFPNILADVANKRLRAAYDENVPTYQRWARRAPNAPDFKNMNVAQISGAPELLKVLEGGEFKYGSMSDGKVTYAISTYGRIIPLTRQAIINDDLSAFDRLPRSFSASARRLENYTVYQVLLANAAMPDGDPLFHANHGNLPSAAAISNTSLGLARAAMRKQVGLQSEKLNLAPRWLLVGPDKEQEAYQYTSANYVPAKPSDVNEFRAGGRTALEPVIDPEISGTKWFLAADNNQIDTVEYCFLDGSEGVFLESQIGFKIDGIEVKARLDFAAAAIDFRGMQYNSGA